MKLLIFLSLLLLINNLHAVTIDCDFSKSDLWTGVGSIYYCNVKNHVNEMTAENSEITQITGNHVNSKGNENVVGIWAQNVNLPYFPKNLHHQFKNLIAIGFVKSGTKEVLKENLKPFGANLKYFRFSENNLEVVERDLFKYNPNLTVVLLQGNKIKMIDPYVFDHLEHLWRFSLKDNICINPNHDTWERPTEDIALAKKICSPEYVKCKDLLEENERLRKKVKSFKEMFDKE